MRNIAVIDAGPFLALFDKDDRYHSQTKESILYFRERQGRLVTTWPVLGEVTYLLHTRISLKAQLRFLEWVLLDHLEIFPLEVAHLNGIMALQRKYSDCPMDFADATVLVAAEAMQTQQIFSLDFKDFSVYRTFTGKPFQNLIEN